MEDDFFEEFELKLKRQKEKLERESNLVGWNVCRHLDDSGERCNNASLYGGYCEKHLLEYAYPQLLRYPRERWPDIAIIANSARFVLMMIECLWLLDHSHLKTIRYILDESYHPIEAEIKESMEITSYALQIFNEYFLNTHPQQLQQRIYLAIQPIHDVGYISLIQGLKTKGVKAFEAI